ncbi:MAG: hypothetical protein DWP98_13780 [Bacteroidetes bacterium]|nr:MAG: hypothetical protein DWP98_13780 [Bacteroidota bacterium]MBL1144608.1 hypothetical protein [Bacteroidota bacterium]NOG57403.1 hypothetical protein [Bacteroidota bacterium]
MNVEEGIKKLIQKTFDIRKGEFKIAFLLQASIFLIIATLLIVKPIVNALFINRFGVESLPQAYVVLAVIAILISTVYSVTLKRLKLITVILRTLTISAIALIAFGVLLYFQFNVGWVIYLFYIWTSIFAVLSASQFWILANVVFNVREAKRIFSFIGIGAISGGILGGYLTSIIVSFVGTEPLLFIAAFLLILCIPINLMIWKKSASKYNLFKRKKRISIISDNPVKSILKSKLLTYLAAILGMSVLVAKLVEYQFSDIASSYITNPEDLAQFFAFWSSNFNLISLIVQLLVTRWVVGNYGVGKSLLILPLGIAFGAIITFTFPELWAVVILKALDGSLKQSVNKSAVELLGLPIPFEIKKRTKTFIDVVVDSVATGIAGFILIFIINGLDLGAEVVSLAIFILSGVWIWLVSKVRKEYLNSFQLLNRSKKEEKATLKLNKSKTVFDSFQKIVSSNKIPQILFLLEQLKHTPDPRFQKHLIPLIHHEDKVVAAKAIKILRYYKEPIIETQAIHELLKSEDEHIRVEAFIYLLKFANDGKQFLIEKYLNNTDEYISSSALLALVENSKSSFTIRNLSLIQTKLAKKTEVIENTKDEDLRQFLQIITIKIRALLQQNEDLETLELYFTHENPIVVKQAIVSAAFTLHERFINPFIDLLGNKIYRNEAKNALSQYGFLMIDELGKKIRTNEIPQNSLHFIPSVLELFENQKAVNELFKLLDHEDLAVRLESIRSLNKIHSNFPTLNIRKRDVVDKINTECKIYLQTLNMMHTQVLVSFHKKDKKALPNISLEESRKSLMKLLESRMESHLERIFGLLGLTYPPEEMSKAYEAIQSEHADMRIYAIEYLDNLLEGNLKRLLIPIVEISILDSISEEILHDLDLKVMGEYECFKLILNQNDTKLKLAVIFLIGQLKDPRYKALLKDLLLDKNLKIRDYANNALMQLES